MKLTIHHKLLMFKREKKSVFHQNKQWTGIKAEQKSKRKTLLRCKRNTIPQNESTGTTLHLFSQPLYSVPDGRMETAVRNYLLHGGKAVPETQETERAKQNTTCGTKAITHSFRRKPRKKKTAIGCFLMKAAKMRIASMGYSSAFRLVCVLEVTAVSEKPRNKSTDKCQIKGNNTRKCLGNELRCYMHNFTWILQGFFWKLL